MGRTPGFHCWGPGSIPGQGTKVPQRTQKKKKKVLLPVASVVSNEESVVTTGCSPGAEVHLLTAFRFLLASVFSTDLDVPGCGCP